MPLWEQTTEVSDGNRVHHVSEKARIYDSLGNDIKERIIVKKFQRDARSNFRDLIIYLIFLAVFSLVQYNSRTPIFAFQYNELMKDLFLNEEFPDIRIYKSFNDIASEEEMWQWVRGALLPGLFGEDDHLIYGTNLLLGSMRMRQVRVAPNKECYVWPAFEKSFDACYAPYDDDAVDTKPFGPNNTWTYYSEDELESFPTIARLEIYEGGGYIEDFKWKSSMYTHQAHALYLEKNGWVGLGTRLVVVDFATYNANTNDFHMAQMYLEYLPTGGIVPSYSFKVARLYKYPNNPLGLLQEFGEIVMALFVLSYFIEELYDMFFASETCAEYWLQAWNVADFINLLLFFVAFCLRIALWVKIKNLTFDATNPNKFYNFSDVAAINATEQNVYAINALLLWFKVLKYTRFLPYFNIITATIGKAARNTSAFMIMVMFVLFGFAQAGWQAFGTDVFGFHSFIDTFYTLMRTLLGDFDFIAMQYSNRSFGPFYFFVYIVLVFFVLLSMFLAILNDSYIEINEEMKNQTQQKVNIVKWAKEYFYRRFPYLKPKPEANKALLDRAFGGDEIGDDDLINMDEIRKIFDDHREDIINHLKLNNPEELLEEFDVDGDALLNKKEQAELINKLHAKKAQFEKTAELLEWDDADNDPGFYAEHGDGNGLGLDTLLLNMRGAIKDVETELAVMVADIRRSKGLPDDDEAEEGGEISDVPDVEQSAEVEEEDYEYSEYS